MTIFISTGEISGDIVAARLAGALRARRPDIRLRGLGGSRMVAAGVDVVDSHTAELAARLAWARDHARARLRPRNVA